MTAKLFASGFSLVFIVSTFLQEATSIPAWVTNGVTLIGAIATIIAAIFGGWVSVITARAAARKAIEPVLNEVKEIKAHVNSEKTRDQGTIISQKQEIDLLREMMNEFKKQMALLAQAKATADLTREVSQAAVAGATGVVRLPAETHVADKPMLQAIEKNTEETATNTKKTDPT